MADQPLDYAQCTPDEREVLLDHLLTHRNALLDEARASSPTTTPPSSSPP